MRVAIVVLCMLFFGSSVAQNKDYKWLVGVGMHGPQFTIKDAFFFDQHFKAKDWNLTPPISRLNVGRHLFAGLSPDLSYSIAKIAVDPKVEKQDYLFMNIDLSLKYSFANGYLLKTKSWFEPYLVAGAGATYFDQDYGLVKDKWFVSINYGLGFNFWLESHIGLFVQGVYHMLPTVTAIQGSTITGDSRRDYMHHAAGLVFRFGKSDRDGDGIADKEDACPDVAGVVALKGCPDKDGDGVADAEDQCLEVKGLVSMAGCPDMDNDGIADKNDACPDVAGKKEFNGCPDTDSDGVQDKEDACPTIAGMMNLKGCPDADGDGTTDADDECPTDYGKLKGCPDTDGDGFADKVDSCPKVAGVAELKGCPKPVIAEEEKIILEKKIATLAKSINFETGKDIIKKESFDELDQVVVFLKEYPDVAFKVEGHTDNVGDPAKNLDLSKKRAAAVKNYLSSKGIPENKLQSEGYGSAKPIADNASAVGRAKNRRVDITVNNQ